MYDNMEHGEASSRGAGPEWFAIQTRAKHEHKIASELQQKGLTTFVPTVREIHRWSDRRKIVDVALFSCYAFVQTTLSPLVHHEVLQTPGVLRWVCFTTGPCAIPDVQINAVRLLIEKQVGYSWYPFLKAGQRVRIRNGCLEGLEGILVSQPNERKLVLSIEPIHRSICICAENYALESV